MAEGKVQLVVGCWVGNRVAVLLHGRHSPELWKSKFRTSGVAEELP